MTIMQDIVYKFILSFDRFFLRVISERKKRDLLLTCVFFYHIDKEKNLKAINQEKFQEIIFSQIEKNASELEKLTHALKTMATDFIIKNERYQEKLGISEYIQNIKEKVEKIRILSDKNFLESIASEKSDVKKIIGLIKSVKEYDEIEI